MNHSFLKCAVMLPTALFSILPNTAFSKSSENLKTLLKNKYFVPILATSILGFSLLLIRKNLQFGILESNKLENKQVVNNSENTQIDQTSKDQEKKHKNLSLQCIMT